MRSFGILSVTGTSSRQADDEVVDIGSIVWTAEKDTPRPGDYTDWLCFRSCSVHPRWVDVAEAMGLADPLEPRRGDRDDLIADKLRSAGGVAEHESDAGASGGEPAKAVLGVACKQRS